MSVVLLTSDLMSASRVAGAVSRSGTSLQTVPHAEAAAATCAAELPVALLIVDLGTSGLDVAALVSQLRAGAGNLPPIVAYGPHVHEALLAAAKSAGCDEVHSRGQFFAQVEAIVARHLDAPR